MRRQFFLLTFITVLAVIGVGCKHKASANGGPTQVAIKSLDGKDVTVAQYKGKVVLVNFWATWCEPCKIEMPSLVDLQKKYGPQGLQIVGVAMDDAEDKEISSFAHKMGVNYLVVRGTEEVGNLYGGIDRLPMTYYLDRSGKVVDQTLGMAGEAAIEDAIKRSLAQGN